MDLYSKIVLTIIAAALCGLLAQNSGVLPAHAEMKISRVQVCGYDSSDNLNCLGVFQAGPKRVTGALSNYQLKP